MSATDSHKHFSGLLAEQLQTVAQTAEIRRYKPGEVVFQEGDPGDGLYVVLEGRIQISALVTQGERRILSLIGPNDFFGEMAVLDNEARSATATAEVESRLYFIRRENLLAELESSPALAVSLVRDFSLRMRDFNRLYIQEVLQAERLTLVGRFARSIVHDFKNPLNVIGLAAELASMPSATMEMRQSAQARIRRQVERLSNMINELLEFSRGSQSKVVLAQTDYAAYVLPLIEEIRHEVAAKSVQIELENEPPNVKLLFDPQRLTHVFFNLIHNACEAMSGNGGKVFLRFKLTENELITEVEDTGRGIAPEIAGKLFQPFATFGKAQGTGLGLSICKKIIEDHRGQISVRSEPNRGAVFVFSLPLPSNQPG